jgi:Mrp family chromosome partitioning ATPase
MYIPLKMAAGRTGLTEEELMSLGLNDMLQFFYPDAEKSWQPVPEEKVRHVYATLNHRPNSAMMSPDEYFDFVQRGEKMWFKEMFFLKEEDLYRIIAHDSYGYIKKYATKKQPERLKKNVVKALGGVMHLFHSRRGRDNAENHSAQGEPKTLEENEGMLNFGGRTNGHSARKYKPSVPSTPRLNRRMLNRHKPALWMVDPDRYSRIVEVFRALSNKIAFVNEMSKKKVFLMTGSDNKVGTSTILFNTGLMMGRSMLDRKILIVDTNIDRPSLHIAFDTSPAVCLMDYLLVGASLADIVQPTFLPNLDIITCNRIDDPLLSPFTRPTFSRFFKEIREKYEIVLLDSAPALRSSHTKMLLPQSDGVLIVAEAGSTRVRVLEELIRQLHMEGATILGSFLNRRRYVIPKWIYRAM